MTLRVDPEGLRAAAGAVAELAPRINAAAHLGAQPEAGKLASSNVGAAVANSDACSKRAKDTIKARFDEFSSLLALSAETYAGTDMDTADRLASLGDLNSGDTHGGN